jgi:hypothetical protein
MQVSSWLLCLWPGLPRLWCRGEWRSLWTALAFAAALNLWFAASFLWTELLPAKLILPGWVALLAFWLVSCWRSRRAWRDIQAGVGDRAPEDLFIRAQGEYLSRHWLEAEHLLLDLVRQHDRDAEAQLLLATLYRRTQRIPEAQERLDALERLEGSQRWRLEIAQERRLIEREESQTEGLSPGTDEHADGNQEPGPVATLVSGT